MGQADFAVLPSGGLRGPGWPAGEVRMSDLWAAYPFINYKCTGVMSGVSVFRLLNYSTAVATFESTFTEMGDRLLQMSGMRMSYNTLVDGSGLGRLMSVDIWDKDAQEYLPLERLKLYKFATDNWVCDHFDPYPLLFGDLQMEGEIPGSVDESINLQSIVGSYLAELNSTYNTSIRGSHVNDTGAFEPMTFIQTEDTCLVDEYWDTKTQACKSSFGPSQSPSLANDPVVGTSGLMPLTRTDDSDDWRICMGGKFNSLSSSQNASSLEWLGSFSIFHFAIFI